MVLGYTDGFIFIIILQINLPSPDYRQWKEDSENVNCQLSKIAERVVENEVTSPI